MEFVSKLLGVLSQVTMSLLVCIGLSVGGLIYMDLSYVKAVLIGFPVGLVSFFILVGFHLFGKFIIDLGTKKMQHVTDNWDTMPKKWFTLGVIAFFVISFLFMLGTAYLVTQLA